MKELNYLKEHVISKNSTNAATSVLPKVVARVSAAEVELNPEENH